MRPSWSISSERRLVEGSQLSRMEAVAPLFEKVESGEPDLQMLSDRRLVESACRARQLDLAMERLIRDAEQRAIGDPQPEALRGDGAAFHVDGDGAGQVDALS